MIYIYYLCGAAINGILAEYNEKRFFFAGLCLQAVIILCVAAPLKVACLPASGIQKWERAVAFGFIL